MPKQKKQATKKGGLSSTISKTRSKDKETKQESTVPLDVETTPVVTPSLSFTVEKLFVGSVKPFVQFENGEGFDSGFIKKSVDGPVRLTKAGLEGDGSATRRVPGAAIYFYPKENYPKLQVLLPEIDSTVFVPGAVGENVSISGFTEKDICIGDIFEVGDAVIQITQPRRPCYRLNHRFQCEKMSVAMQNSALTGWMGGVIKEGDVSVGSRVTLQKRVYPKITVAGVLDIYNDPNLEKSEMQEMHDCEILDKKWKAPLKSRLEDDKIPKDVGRLVGGKLKFKKDKGIQLITDTT